MTLRYFLEFAYKGTNYHGWQRQPNATTVQELIEVCIEQVLRSKITLNGSSRTDTGVHAAHQVAHFDTEIEISNNFVFRLNSCLPKDIAILALHLKDDNCHSRFDASERSYIYRLHTHKNPFLVDTSLHFSKPLDFDLMNQAAALMLDHSNFECFSKVRTEVNNFNCDIREAEWLFSDHTMEFKITANRFLRGMVRAIVGTLLEVGQGKRSLQDFQDILNSNDRSKAGANVKAHGLTLEKVAYPKGYFEK